jgi:hypothetical protein
MIRVVRIAGESFDLETKKEMPKALILSNGAREFALYVDDESAREVLQMMLETTPEAQLRKAEEPRAAAPSPSRPIIPAKGPAPASSPAPAEVHKYPAKTAPKPPPMASVEDEVEDEVEDDNSGFEPGEEYNDPATGAESL